MIIIKRHHSGFNLVELMVVIAILGVLIAVAIPALQDWIRNARVRSTTESIMAGFQIARNEALRRNSTVRMTLNADTSWLVGCDPANDADANGDGLEDCPSIIKSRSAKDGSVKIAATVTPNNSTSVLYSGFGRVVGGIENPITSVDIPSVVDVGVTPLRIIVTGGSIKMCDPAMATGDPKAC